MLAPRSTSGSISLGVAIVVEDFFGRARREEGAYREYATDEQQRLGEKRPTAMVMNGATDPLEFRGRNPRGHNDALGVLALCRQTEQRPDDRYATQQQRARLVVVVRRNV